jgi:hypothetical protein
MRCNKKDQRKYWESEGKMKITVQSPGREIQNECGNIAELATKKRWKMNDESRWMIRWTGLK